MCRLGERSYDIAIGDGLIGDAGRVHQAAISTRPVTAIVTDDNVARLHLKTLAASLWPRPGSSRTADRPAGRRSDEELSVVSPTFATACSRAGIERRDIDHRLGRRRDRRSRRLCRSDPAARRRLHPDPDDAPGAGRFLGRRQDRHQFAARQESHRRVPSAACRPRRHRPARHAAAPRARRRLCRSREIRPPRRCAVLRLARDACRRDIFAGDTQRPHPGHHAGAARPRRASSPRTKPRPACARSSISATLSAMRWKPRPAIPTRSCMARRSRSAWRRPSAFRKSSASCRGRPRRGSRRILPPVGLPTHHSPISRAACRTPRRLLDIMRQDKKADGRQAHLHPGARHRRSLHRARHSRQRSIGVPFRGIGEAITRARIRSRHCRREFRRPGLRPRCRDARASDRRHRGQARSRRPHPHDGHPRQGGRRGDRYPAAPDAHHSWRSALRAQSQIDRPVRARLLLPHHRYRRIAALACRSKRAMPAPRSFCGKGYRAPAGREVSSTCPEFAMRTALSGRSRWRPFDGRPPFPTGPQSSLPDRP